MKHYCEQLRGKRMALAILVLLMRFCSEARYVPVEWNRQFPMKNVIGNSRTETFCDVKGSCKEGLDVGVLQSTEPPRSNTRLIPPLISGVVSTIGGLPSVTVGFCATGRKEVCTLSTDVRASSPSSNFWKRAMENRKDRISDSNTRTPNLHLLNFGPQFFVGESIFALGMQIGKIVEFEDRNANQMFDEGIDGLLQEINVKDLEPFRMNISSAVVFGETYMEHEIEISSSTVFNLQCQMTPVTDRSLESTSEQRLRSQNSLRCVLKLTRFPYLTYSSSLALQLIFISPNAFEEYPVRDNLKHSVTFTDRSSLSPRCFFSWTPIVYSSNQVQVNVKLSSLSRMELDSVDYSLAKSIIHWNRAESKSFESFASISNPPRSDDILEWDFSIGYGTPPMVRENHDDLISTLLLLVAIIVLVFLSSVWMNTHLGGNRRVALKCCCGSSRRHLSVADIVWGYFNDDNDVDESLRSNVKTSLLEKHMKENDGVDDDLAFVHTTSRKPKILFGKK